ncbi:helix-turn-helix transcriptional regulator [uncultured Pantoea sp.]|uniref:helix-turn-helix transcriptional regulator n=1 Tax=uncultured Pantoea sp. TaxID=218084 RepID=UPI002582FB83|nr:helix-turn-helix transcriptional regulator [uncultured Pantoea sp.]
MHKSQAEKREAKRKAFGEFLRSRRERLMPATAGLTPGVRRRTPGLRREEVAQLAGVGTTWYTWLEQGRDVRPSVDVLTALAGALMLSPDERRHLFILADRLPLGSETLNCTETVPDALIHMLKGMKEQPAYVLGRRWDILAWNAAAIYFFGDFARLEGDARNMMHLIFTSERYRNLLKDWNDVARLSLAMFRADSALYVGDTGFERLTGLLMESSEEFSAWWPLQDVLQQPSTLKRILHPTEGLIEFEYLNLDVSQSPGMRFIVCTPRPL